MATGDPAYEQVKERALKVLLDGATRTDREAIEKFLAAIEQRTLTAAEADRTLKTLLVESQRLAPAGGKSLFDILQSPPFYFFFGFGLLGLAFFTSGWGLNTSLTFLVAMLGVATMLYGTGSQAAGAFGANPEVAAALLRERQQPPVAPTTPPATPPPETPPPEGTPPPEQPAPLPQPTRGSISPTAANLVIAGGAAVLTAFFGWGVITYQNEIRQVFRDYDQYTKLRVEFCDAAVTRCADPDTLDNVALQAPEPGRSVLTDETLRQIRASAYLETGLGERAYGKADDNGLEFIIFDRDLGRSGTIKLIGAAAIQDATKYAADVSYFSFREPAASGSDDPNCLARLSQDSCGYIITVRDGIDLDRVPRVVIRAVLSPQSIATETPDPVVPE